MSLKAAKLRHPIVPPTNREVMIDSITSKIQWSSVTSSQSSLSELTRLVVNPSLRNVLHRQPKLLLTATFSALSHQNLCFIESCMSKDEQIMEQLNQYKQEHGQDASLVPFFTEIILLRDGSDTPSASDTICLDTATTSRSLTASNSSNSVVTASPQKRLR